MTPIHTIAKRIGLAGLLACAFATSTPLLAAISSDAMAPADRELNQLYWQGHDAIGKSDWKAALDRFIDLEKRLRASEPASADAAIYWQAYTLAHANRETEARATIARLHKDFPTSRWGKDADALLRRNTASTTTAASINADDDLAEFAVQGLLSAPPERALPILKKVLQGQQPNSVKKRALFVLSQLDSDAALDAVGDVARNGSDPELRSEAIRMLGVSGDKRAGELLSTLYVPGSAPEQKKAIIQAWLIADRKDLVLAKARDETEPDIREQAIHVLGAMGGGDELKALFDSTSNAGSQREIVRALGIAGNVEALRAIAAGTHPEDVRVTAIESLGIAGDEGGSAALVALYPTATTPPLREAVLRGLMIAGDSTALLKLYRQATDAAEKKALLRMITISGGDAAIDLIESELNK
ncbi:MAG: HEAT repeat domain-containing protein [Dokdonella sp.]